MAGGLQEILQLESSREVMRLELDLASLTVLVKYFLLPYESFNPQSNLYKYSRRSMIELLSMFKYTDKQDGFVTSCLKYYLSDMDW